MTRYSVILPVRNEAESLPQLFSELKKALAGQNFEVIAVDDASTDKTRQQLYRIAETLPELTIIHLKSHLGKWPALRAGLAKAKADIVITLDSDLQDDPRELAKLLKKFNQGYDVISGWRQGRQDAGYKVILTKFGNFLVSRFTGHRFFDFSSPFKVYRRQALDQLPHEGSLLRYSLLFAQKLGLETTEVPVVHRPRLFGQSKFGLLKYLRIIYDVTLILLLFSGSGRLGPVATLGAKVSHHALANDKRRSASRQIVA